MENQKETQKAWIWGAVELAQSVKCLPEKHRDTNPIHSIKIKKITKPPQWVVHNCSPNVVGVETGWSLKLIENWSRSN